MPEDILPAPEWPVHSELSETKTSLQRLSGPAPSHTHNPMQFAISSCNGYLQSWQELQEVCQQRYLGPRLVRTQRETSSSSKGLLFQEARIAVADALDVPPQLRALQAHPNRLLPSLQVLPRLCCIPP